MTSARGALKRETAFARLGFSKPVTLTGAMGFGADELTGCLNCGTAVMIPALWTKEQPHPLDLHRAHCPARDAEEAPAQPEG